MSKEGEWQTIDSAPRDGTMMDVMFDPATAERDEMGSLAEFYVPGSTRRKNPAPAVIEEVHFSRGHFRPGYPENGFFACDMAVKLTHWRKRPVTICHPDEGTDDKSLLAS